MSMPSSSRSHPQIGRAHVCTPVTQRSTRFPYTTLFRSVDAGRLFGINMTKLAVRRGNYLRKYVHAFIESFAPTDRKSTRLYSSHTEIYTLSLHDALPICGCGPALRHQHDQARGAAWQLPAQVCPCLHRVVRTHRSEEHTSVLQSHRDLHAFPTRRSSDLWMRAGSSAST